MDKSFNDFLKLSSVEYFAKQKDYSSLYNLLKKCRVHGFYYMGYYIGKILEQTKIYQYLDELAMCAYYIGEYQESYDLYRQLIYICPEHEKPRMIQNKKYCIDKLGIKDQFNLEQFKQDTQLEISTLPYKKYWYQFTDTEKCEIAQEMKDLEIHFETELNLKIYPVYGTLLGMIRDNDFIGWDTDIDLAYLSNYHTNEEVLAEFNIICNKLTEKGLLLKRIKTASHLHVYSPSKRLKTDLWISWIDTNGNYHLVWTVWGDIDSSMILPFKTVEFKNQIFRQMNNPELFLNTHYGNWINPVGGSAENWNKRKFVFELEPWHGK